MKKIFYIFLIIFLWLLIAIDLLGIFKLGNNLSFIGLLVICLQAIEGFVIKGKSDKSFKKLAETDKNMFIIQIILFISAFFSVFYDLIIF